MYHPNVTLCGKAKKTLLTQCKRNINISFKVFILLMKSVKTW